MTPRDVECDALLDLPPSAKLVFKVLEYNGELTQKQIAERSMLSGRTVRAAVSRLEAIDAIEARVNITDARQNLYRIPECSAAESPGEEACCAD